MIFSTTENPLRRSRVLSVGRAARSRANSTGTRVRKATASKRHSTENVDHRARVGHWEGDLINGLNGTGHLVTAVERFSRFALVGYSATKETDSVMAVFLSLFKGFPPEIVQTLTLDNGKEFCSRPVSSTFSRRSEAASLFDISCP